MVSADACPEQVENMLYGGNDCICTIHNVISLTEDTIHVNLHPEIDALTDIRCPRAYLQTPGAL